MIKMNKLKLKYLLISFFSVSIIFVSCENPFSSPPEIPIETLLSAPDTVEVDSQKIFLTTYLWRDFMPVSPPDGKPLNAVVNIQNVDSSDLPSGLEAEAIYIVNANEIWNSYFSKEIPPDNSSFQLVRIARDGPKWNPGIYVDVIVLLKFNKESILLKASDQIINRTD